MKIALKEIKPGFGLGNLKFGMTRAEVKLMLGEPSFIDKYSHSDSSDDLTESWEYDELKLSLSFDEEDDWKLIMISIYSNFYELKGKSLIGLDSENLQNELEEMKFGNLTLEDCSDFDGQDQEVIEIDEKSINFWINDGVLDEIQWSPFFIDDDRIKWPE
ncbi:MAG: hypothetical protein HKP59_06460 [Lutibacter sp.]|uniref:hypothetical protein n=1 Tax=Lutibacter sp. TaxID=1925666 RepID=UPI00179CDC8C|nr:hypothetical protein [Lutibacter sp.]MBT8317249.1 outer membrane protein assembly factor BamE [Lutibacter sp.]NNJ58108.1 hypothetical protein [Lutibacter sp.]